MLTSLSVRRTFGALILLLIPTATFAQGTCPAANPDDYVSDDAAINQCLSQGGTVSLRDGSVGYIVETGLNLTVSGTVFKGNTGRPKIFAHPNLTQPILKVGAGVSSFTVQDLAFDGYKSGRATTSYCTSDRPRMYNIRILPGASYWTLLRVDSDNAPCGTGAELDCDHCTIESSRFRDNGSPYTLNPALVADGLTVWNCRWGSIKNNIVAESTDVNLVIGAPATGGGHCETAYNQVTQMTVQGQVGLVVNVGNHWSSTVHHNTITSGLGKLSAGLYVGVHRWDYYAPVGDVGSITYNHIDGAVILAAVDGAASGYFDLNTGANQQGSLPPGCLTAAYTAGDFGAMYLQPGWTFQTYHLGGCQY